MLNKIEIKAQIHRGVYQKDIADIFNNLNPKPIPGLGSVLGWDVLLKALLPGQGNTMH